jgi:excisionase family DNA binding protein
MKTDEILTLKQVAEYLQLSPLTVYRLTKRGILPGVKLGNQWRYWKKNIEKIMKEPEALNPINHKRKVA